MAAVLVYGERVEESPKSAREMVEDVLRRQGRWGDVEDILRRPDRWQCPTRDVRRDPSATEKP
jgi:hypothetical protein